MATNTPPNAPEAPTPIAEIDHGPSAFEQFLDKHTKTLIIAAILIAIAALGYVIYSGMQDSKAKEAGNALLTAENVDDYQEVIRKYGDSNAAATALTLMASVQWDSSQPDAISTLEDFLAKYPEHPAAATAQVNLAMKQLDMGKVSDAKQSLNDTLDRADGDYIKPLAMILLGDIAKAEKDPDTAKSWYEKAAEDTPGIGNSFADTARDRLTLVNAKPPEKIQPALPTPPTPPAPALEPADAAPAAPIAPTVPPTPAAPATLPAKPEAPVQPEQPVDPTEPQLDEPETSHTPENPTGKTTE